MKNALRHIAWTVVFLLTTTGLACADDAAQPSRRTQEYSWMSVATWNKMHDAFLARAKAGDIDLLFLGDSITQGWGENAPWKKYFAPHKAANFGIGGDTTRTVLWRITNGELDGIHPKAVVLLIGTNNFGLHGDKPEDVLRGVTAVVATLRERLPQAKILLMGVLPRDAKPDTDFRRRIKTLNEGLAKLQNGESVRYLDIGDKFLAADGTLPKELMPDALHLSEQGYNVWAEAIDPIVKAWLK
ncbi:MAG: GDSL family lipase [Planctomycetia bacterium]|nr:GDSL family lipase [Planctomycetia bacterium]